MQRGLSLSLAFVATVSLHDAAEAFSFAPSLALRGVKSQGPTFSHARRLRFSHTAPRMVAPEVAQAMMDGIGPVISHTSSAMPTMLPAPNDPSMLLAFADQGGNLAGKFFQASLLPYLFFLSFINNDKNNTPKTSFFGFQFLLLFVIATIPTGIISKTVYGVSLADVDWLHGSAEALLTVTNLLIVYGFKTAMSGGDPKAQPPALKFAALGAAAAVAAVAATGSNMLGFQAHTPFLAGIGDLGAGFVSSLGLPAEPANALSIPTWAIHFSSVYEWVFAMGLVWKYAEYSGNPTWKGLTWGMLPLHASGIAACTYHFFYNSPDLAFLVALQAGLTCLGNTTIMLAALRIAKSNGWQLSDLNPLSSSSDNAKEAQAGVPEALAVEEEEQAAKTRSAAASTKYGELALALPFAPNALVATLMVAAPPALVALSFLQKGQEEGSQAASEA